MAGTVHTIVCLSSQDWGDRMWTNKQHIMSRLAKQHRVIHMDFRVSSPVTFAARALRHDPSLALKPRRLWSEGILPEPGAGNLYVGKSWGPTWARAIAPNQRGARSLSVRRKGAHRAGVPAPRADRRRNHLGLSPGLR